MKEECLSKSGRFHTVHTAIAERFRAGLQDPEAARQAVTIAWLDLAGQLNAMSMQERTDSGFRTVDTEWLNFSYIWKVLLEKGESENRLWPLARLLRGYLDVRGRYQDGVALFGRADAALIEGHDRELRGWMRECVALFNHKLGRNQEAAGIAGTAIGFLRPLGDNQTLAMTLNTAGLIAMQLGNHPAALEHLEEAASMRDALGDAIGAAQARGNRLANLEAMGRETEALEGMAAAAAQYRQLGHPSGLAAMLVRQGKLLYRLREDLAGEAMQLMQEGLDLAESIGYAETASSGARAMAESHAHLGRHAEAAVMYERAVTWETQRPEVARRLLLSAAEQRERHTRSLAGGRFGG